MKIAPAFVSLPVLAALSPLFTACGIPTRAEQDAAAYPASATASLEKRDGPVKAEDPANLPDWLPAARAAFPDVVAEMKTYVGRTIVTPKPITTPQPYYPFRERLFGREPSINVAFIVEADGHVSGVKAIGNYSESFVQVTTEAVRRWRFKPGTVDGEPRRFFMAVPIIFQLDKK